MKYVLNIVNDVGFEFCKTSYEDLWPQFLCGHIYTLFSSKIPADQLENVMAPTWHLLLRS